MMVKWMVQSPPWFMCKSLDESTNQHYMQITYLHLIHKHPCKMFWIRISKAGNPLYISSIHRKSYGTKKHRDTVKMKQSSVKHRNRQRSPLQCFALSFTLLCLGRNTNLNLVFFCKQAPVRRGRETDEGQLYSIWWRNGVRKEGAPYPQSWEDYEQGLHFLPSENKSFLEASHWARAEHRLAKPARNKLFGRGVWINCVLKKIHLR